MVDERGGVYTILTALEEYEAWQHDSGPVACFTITAGNSDVGEQLAIVNTSAFPS